MNSAQELLLDRSHYYLLHLRYEVEPALEGRGPVGSIAYAAELGRAQFDAIGGLLKACLDRGDASVFATVKQEWDQIFDDVWLPGFPGLSESLDTGWHERTGAPPSPELVALLRRREILRFGLVMWATHLLATTKPPQHRKALTAAVASLSAHFDTIELVLEAFEAADGEEGRDATPWTTWFLSELPSGQAHFIPTSEELLFAALLLCARVADHEGIPPLQPRDWFKWRNDEISGGLDHLAQDEAKWSDVVVAADEEAPTADATGESSALATRDPAAWKRRVERLRALFDEGRRAQEETERAHVRASAVDATRVDEVTREVLARARAGRVIRDTLAQQRALVGLPAKPQGYEGLASRTWAPKSFFTVDSRLVGLERVGQDIGLRATNAERDLFVAALPDAAPERIGDVRDGLIHAVEELRAAGFEPSLVVIPISWRLKQTLEMRDLWDDKEAQRLIPAAHMSEFEGSVAGLPVIRIHAMPKDRIWILDVKAAVKLTEWPSQQDSGIRFEITFFDAATATQFVHDNPDVRVQGETVEEAILGMQERALISVYLCWRIEALDERATRAIAVPEDLQRPR